MTLPVAVFSCNGVNSLNDDVHNIVDLGNNP